jgi:hypothetical protein
MVILPFWLREFASGAVRDLTGVVADDGVEPHAQFQLAGAGWIN